MKLVVRISLYLLLLLLAGYFFGRFRDAYEAIPEMPAMADSPADLPAPTPATPETNALTGSDTPAATNPVPEASLTGTNAGISAPPGSTNPAPSRLPVPAGKRRSDSVRSLGLFVLFFLALGGLAAWDLSQYLGNRAGRAVMAEDWVERKDPEYEKAEEEWSKGNHLDAISLMREYLAKNPREQHVALRIAEIYEKDLGNHLAAALELQEVLTRRLPREKWGWTAVRLSNLYSGRLNQPAKALALLERIVNEYPETGAAKKARSRLGIPEPQEAAPEPDVTPEPAAAEDPAPPPTEPPPPESHLPRGFRPKK
ncbi:MAG: hypothetical protein KF791_09175 [Verrucomicrobiae bacterium]|nr:hypothetical protein [Verrucomicrobiae bacterium]